jgi:hypothetical protein
MIDVTIFKLSNTVSGPGISRTCGDYAVNDTVNTVNCYDSILHKIKNI